MTQQEARRTEQQAKPPAVVASLAENFSEIEVSEPILPRRDHTSGPRLVAGPRLGVMLDVVPNLAMDDGLLAPAGPTSRPAFRACSRMCS